MLSSVCTPYYIPCNHDPTAYMYRLARMPGRETEATSCCHERQLYIILLSRQL